MFKLRLQRLRWLYTDCPVYFITSCTADRRPVLANNAMHRAFMAFARQAESRGVMVGRYVIMPDHIHLFAAFRPEALKLSDWMKGLKRALAKEQKDGAIWQKGFFDHLMRSGESYSQKWNYVAQNPVRAGLVHRPEDWPYQGEIHQLTVAQL